MAIKAITIDFWNTLFDSSNGTGRNQARMSVIRHHISKYNKEISNELFDNALKSTWENFNKIWFSEQRTPSPIESVEYFWGLLGLPYDEVAIDEIAYIFANSILEYPPKLIPTINQINYLASKYKLGIVSDTGFSPGTVLRSLMHKNGIYEAFSEFSFSDETGVSKPHKDAYLRILNSFSINPNEALHIGDIERTDIIGAKNLGMFAIRYSGDKTAFVEKENPTKTVADAEFDNWNDIINFIDNIG